MSQENVKVLREALAAFNRRDRAAWLALCDPNLENLPPRDWPESAPIQGGDAVFDFYTQGNEPWEDSPLEHAEIIDVDDHTLVAHVRGEVQGRASGAGVHWSFWQVVTLRKGKAVRIEWFGDRAQAFEAVGLAE
jgi:ketosteroid isomerase-like protein